MTKQKSEAKTDKKGTSVLDKKSVDKIETLTKTDKAADLFAYQKEANKTVAKGIKQYQIVLCAAILHVAKHRNTTVIKHVLENFPEGMRKKAAVNFINAFSTVEVGQDDKGGMTVSIVESKKLQLGTAIETPWQKMAADENLKPFNLMAELSKLVNRANKRAEKAEEGDDISPELLAMLAGTVNRFNVPENKAEAA